MAIGGGFCTVPSGTVYATPMPSLPFWQRISRGGNALQALWQIFCQYVPVMQLPFQLLPPGWWEKGDGNGALPPTVRIRTGPTLLPARFQFLVNLGPIQVYEGKTNGLGRKYEAYVIQTAKGRFALVECALLGNALYVFKADTQVWMALIQLTKLDLLTGNYPEFLGRVVHQGNWQARATALI